MKKNMGTADTLIRLTAAALAAFVVLDGMVSGSAAILTAIAGGLLLLTASVQRCPLYLPFGIRTNKK